MSPDQKTIYPLTIEQHDSDRITLSDHYHSIILELNNLPDLQVKPWYPVIKKELHTMYKLWKMQLVVCIFIKQHE